MVFFLKLNFEKRISPTCVKNWGAGGSQKSSGLNSLKQKVNILVFKSAIKTQNNLYALDIFLAVFIR